MMRLAMLSMQRSSGTCRKRRSGVTLLEAIIYSAVWAMLAITTMQALGQARMIRSNARDRSKMVLIAQSELERLRQIPAAQLREKTEVRSEPSWPSGVRATLEVKPREGGLWLLDVRVERSSIEGKPSVRLTTLRAGGGQ